MESFGDVVDIRSVGIRGTSDYEDITKGLLFAPESYETGIQSLQKILDSGMWKSGGAWPFC